MPCNLLTFHFITLVPVETVEFSHFTGLALLPSSGHSMYYFIQNKDTFSSDMVFNVFVPEVHIIE